MGFSQSIWRDEGERLAEATAYDEGIIPVEAERRKQQDVSRLVQLLSKERSTYSAEAVIIGMILW